MAASILLLKTVRTIKKTNFLITFHLIPNTSSYSSSSSSLCKSNTQTHTPPVPKKVPFTVSAHGYTWQDPYHWMSKTDDPDFINYLHQENSYADAFMSDTQNLRRTISDEIKTRMPLNVTTPPQLRGPWLYYQYIPEGKEYPVFCRKLATNTNSWMENVINCVKSGFRTEQILLDWNEIAEQHGYVHVGTCTMSPDYHYMAYTIDITGKEQFTLQIKDLQSRRILPKTVNGVVSLVWGPDSRTLFYTVADENQRPYRVQITKLGSFHIDDVIIYTENNPGFVVDITSTKDGEFVTVNSNSRTSSEEGTYFCYVHIVDAKNPLYGLRRFNKRVPGVQCFVEHHHGFFYILTNADLGKENDSSTGNYYLARCLVEDLESDNWQTIIAPSEDVNIQDMDIFDEYLVLFLNKKGSNMICSIKLPIDISCKNGMGIDSLDPWYFPVPSDSCTIVPGSNLEFMSSVFRAVLSSPVTPDIIIDYDMSQKTFSMAQQEDIMGISRSDNDEEDSQNGVVENSMNLFDMYTCETKEVISHDGVSIRLVIIYSRKTSQNRQSPGILHGYGAYGEVLDKSWSPELMSLLDRGWVIAFADVRGGSGVDPSWHKHGRGHEKINSIKDFVSCGEYLINEGYVHKYRLSALGRSAGGLLVGAAINMYPHLFRAAILEVPFLDICNTLLDPSLPLTVLDYEEFGNPQIKSELDSILSYSPYDNIHEGVCYPWMLLTSSFHDSRVGVWEAAKWVAKVRDCTCPSCSSSVILKTNMSGGHFGEGGRFSHCEETAFKYAFLMKALGICEDKK